MVEIKSVNSHHRHKQQENQGKLEVDAEQDHKHTNEFDECNRKVFWSVMAKFAHPEQVIGNSGHQRTRFLLVKKTKRQFLIVLEQIAAHVALHFCAHHVTLVIDKLVADNVDYNQSKHQRANLVNLIQRIWCVTLENIFGDITRAQWQRQSR